MKKVVYVVLLASIIVVSFNLLKSSYSLWRKQDLFKEAQNELKIAKQENKELKESLESAKKQEFVEEEARNKLLWVKEGENRAIVSKADVEAPRELEKPVNNRPNYKKWLDLFF